jgi:hypothetical protein
VESVRVLPSNDSEESKSDEEENPIAEQKESPTSLDVNKNKKGVAENKNEPVEGVSTGTAPTTVTVQGGTELRSAPVQEPVVKVHTSVPHQTTANVLVPLQTAMDVTPVMTKRVLPLSQIIALAAAHNPSHQVGNVRDLMKEAKRRDPTRIVP